MISEVLFFAVVGFIVSLDAVALTFARLETYDPNTSKRDLLGWARRNALWHGGLLLFYVFFFETILNAVKGALSAIDIEWLKVAIPYLGPQIAWFIVELQRHFFTIFAIVAMLLVWFTYSKKVKDTPANPNIENLDWWLRFVVSPMRRIMSERSYRENLQAALVAVDMLALAALLKASEEAMSTSQKIAMTVVVAAVVFALVYAAAVLARAQHADTAAQLAVERDYSIRLNIKLSQFWILLGLRLLEPFLIFYFLLKLMARLGTGSDVTSPALLFASAFMVVAIVKLHGLPEIVKAVRTKPVNQ